MATTKIKGVRANKPNDSFGVTNNPNLYRGKYREEVYKDDEDEENNETQEEQQQDPTEVATQEKAEPKKSFVESQKKEESTDYKKRYDDLKKHYDSKLEEWKDEKLHLSDQIKAAQISTAEIQENDKGLENFKTQYPDVYDAINKITASNSDTKVEKLQQELDIIKEREKTTQKEKSFEELLRLQPDFNTLKDNEEFLGWLDKQPNSISDGIYNNSTDAKWASRVIDLYKADMGSTSKKPITNKKKDAAMSVSKTSATNIAKSDESNKKVWKSSEIAKLKSWEFEKLEKEIDLAREEGRIDINN